MGLRLRQFKLLLWKNWLLQLRRPIGTVFEILVPLCFAALLLMTRILLKAEVKCFATYDNSISNEDHTSLFLNSPTKALNKTDLFNIDIASLSDKELCDLGFCERLTYFPQNELTFALMSTVSSQIQIPLSNRSFSSEEVMAKTAAEDEDNFYGAVVFLFDEDTTELPLEVKYRIRLSHTLTDFGTWYTNEVYPPFEEIGPRVINDYKNRFLSIQFALDRVITIAQSVNHDPIKAATLSLQMQQFPYPDYREDVFISTIQFLLPILMVLAFIYSSGTIVKELVIEKETRLKESMKMMGLANWIHWLAWFVKSYTFLLISTILIVLLLKFGKVFEYSNGIVLLLFFMLWMFASTMWSFMISVFFSKSRLGFIFGLILWYLNYLPVQFLDYNKQSATIKTLASLLSNTNMAFAMNIFARYESRGEGISWENISVTPSPGDSFNLGVCFIMLMVDSLIYFLIMWYVEQVFPGQYGIPQPLYFPLQRSYWFGPSAHGADVNPNFENGIAMERISKKNHEEAPNLEVGIDIKNLRKVYKSSVGKKLAVDDLSLKMYKGQITSLLGHNGAGKTTTMSILTGLFPPTSGTANINGKSIINDIQSVRSSLGLCPQHNVLFDRLTVKEHLDFFINLKGKSGKEADAEVKSMIQDLQLVDKTNTASSSLSGGMKRKLCCAIALIGGSEIVILDEPTSGMDPYARRATWDLLLKYKAGKTMVLTTHFMDEADLLGDRIAIMAHGQLLCSGSSLFLKNRYGVGYHMTLVKNQDCQVDLLTKTIQEFVPGSYLESNIGAELTYILPGESTSMFQKLFEHLEAKRTSLGVDSFGVSVTTLEEVFMKAGEAAEAKVNGVDTNEENGGASTTMQHIQEAGEKVDFRQLETKREDLLSGCALKTQQFKAMFIKRFLNSKRDRKAVITQFLLPLLFVFCGLLIISVGDGTSNDPELELSLSMLTDAEDNDHKAYYANFVQNTVHQDVFQDLESYLKALDIKPLNVESKVTQIETDNTGKVKGKEVPVNAQSCCQYNFFILNASCALLLKSQNDMCDEYPDYAYTNCKECINDTETDNGDVCPIDAQTSILSDPNTYFQEYVLQEDKDDTPGFFNEYVAGFTAIDTPFDAQQTVSDLYGPYGNGNQSSQFNASFVKKLQSTDLYDLALNVTNGTLVTAWYSNEAIHTTAEVLNAISNVMLMSVTNSSYSIKAFNYPLPKSADTLAEDATSNEDTFGMAILVVFAMAFLTASFIGFIVTEKENKAKHLQFVSGVDTLSYWGATFVWDMCNYTIVYVIIIIIFAAYDLDAFGGENLGTVALIFFLYGWMSIPFTYTLSFMFKTPVTATALTTFLLAFVSMITVIAIFILELLGEKISDDLDYAFSIIPTHCLGRALMVLSNNDALRRFCTATEQDKISCGMKEIIYQENNLAWDRPGVGIYCLYMAAAGLVFIILTLLIEVNFFIPARSASYLKGHVPNPDEEDVALEREKVLGLNSQNDESAVLLKNLSKVYRKKPTPAVDQLCLSIPKGQCFGLLGVNGAGKTTTFGMLTGDLGITAGTAYMDGYDIQTQRRLVQQRIGYCPQFDALIERLTGREVLSMYARLRGIPSHQIDAVVETTVTHLSLSNWADKLCGDYSGGNKRKLSTGIALVGNPPIMFLDEPTSGMDPTARRYLWNALTSIMKGGRSIVLTSHSMEECEVLCTRLAIMVNGQFKCLGSTQHLKSRYGKGYTMLIKMEENFQTGGLKQFVNDQFPGSVLLEEHQGVLQYQVENSNLSWSYIFGTLENNKQMLKIEDYSVSQTTLEQVFINFAKEQHDETGHARRMSKKNKTEYIERPATGASLGRNSLRRSLRGVQSPTPQSPTQQSPTLVSENPPPPYNQAPQYTEAYEV
ncbi:ATP-binding cassette sub-family A member 3-like [Anneissia japonica]|uniref:ATP-binding cassette sub-family A member 3-like n=1 Tax=Anneissia japonica TaxID=1529436 RepID=UPI001425B690|nr:ATP-binding cassette sub-family A member 3-like [Anneissia japonica]XP_033114080.1 ATP-binding cassette sub-family A member 3-like [Anneissia japonica]